MTLYTGATTWDAMFPADCVIKVEQKGTKIAKTITTRVTNFEDGGGAQDTESIAHFGNAFLTVTKPQAEFEVNFDVSQKDTFWMQVANGSVQSAQSASGSTIMAKSGGDKSKYKIKLEWRDDNGSDAYKIIYYDAYAVSYEKSNAADDRLTATIGFKLSPTSALGSGLKYEIETSILSDASVGSTLVGSYGAWEAAADTLLGYGTGSMLY